MEKNSGSGNAREEPDVSRWRVGDVFQIVERHGRKGWIGALVTATQIATWGIQGFVVHVKTTDEQSRVYIRLNWSDVEYVGHAPLILEDELSSPK